jgi:hypothetical protein
MARRFAFARGGRGYPFGLREENKKTRKQENKKTRKQENKKTRKQDNSYGKQ